MQLRTKVAFPIVACMLGLAGGLVGGLTPARPALAAITGGPVIALAPGNVLLGFEATAPGAILSSVGITGLAGDETVVALDVRPSNGLLYAVALDGPTGHLYTVNSSNGEATLVNDPAMGVALPTGGRWSMDVNPVVDRIRLVHSSGASYRINPVNGSVAAVDTTVGPARANAIAHDRVSPGAAEATTLFSIDTAASTLNLIGGVDGNPSANGGATTPRGPLGVATSGQAAGFDIAASGDALAALRVGGASQLYNVDLSTGAATLVGTIGASGAATILDLALPWPPRGAIVALTDVGTIVRFDASSPGSITATVPVSGLLAGERLAGIDVRPATGEVVALGVRANAGRLYRLDPVGGGLTLIGGGAFDADLPTGGTWAVDVNPVNDRIRAVHSSGFSARLNPTTAEVAGIDVDISGAKPTAIAHDRSVTGVPATTLYSIDDSDSTLNIIGGPNGTPSPNSGAATLRGSLSVTVDSGEVGFDVMSDGKALATLRVDGFTGLYVVDLASGLASPVGTVGSGAMDILDIAALPPLPEGASQFTPLAPARLLDTRDAAKPRRNSTIDLQVTGVGGVPANATAVVLNVTGTEANSEGFITIFPTGTGRPVASNSNLAEGGTKAILATSKLGVNGQISIYSQASAHIVVDVFGYYSPPTTKAGRLTPLAPARLYDSRELGSLKPGEQGYVSVQVNGLHGVPVSGVSAVIVNLTVTENSEPGYVQVYASGTGQPATSNLNVDRVGGTVSNAAIVPVGEDGRIMVYTQRSAHIIVDVSGWYGTEVAPGGYRGLFVPVNPSRVLDTRDGTGSDKQPVAAQSSIDVTIADRAGVPESGASGVIVNLTAVQANAPGYVTLYPAGTVRQLVASLNVDLVEHIVPNLVASPLGGGGKVSIFHQTGGHLVADVAGWFTA